MSMKKIGWLLAGLVLLTSCLKDRNDDETDAFPQVALDASTTYDAKTMSMLAEYYNGTYEGEWSFSLGAHGFTEPGQLKVNGNRMEFVLPERNILKTFVDVITDAFSEEYTDLNLMDPSLQTEQTYSSLTQRMDFRLEGVSGYNNYIGMFNSYTGNNTTLFTNVENFEYDESLFADDIPNPGSNSYFFGVVVKGNPMRVELSGKSSASALFDLTTKLWTLILPADEFNIINLKTGEDFPLSIPGEGGCKLLFNATKKNS